MKTIEILEVADVQAVIDQAFAPWVQWSDMIVEKLSAIESINRAQNKKINALSQRVEALEERLASSDIYTNEYTDY